MPVRAPAPDPAPAAGPPTPGPDVAVFVPYCIECGRAGDGAMAWDTPADAPSPLPRCRCGAEPKLVRVDVNDVLLRASASAIASAPRAPRA